MIKGGNSLVIARVRWVRLALVGAVMIFLAAYIFQPPEHIHSPLTAALWSPVLMPSRWLTSVVIFYFGAVVAMIATLAALGRPALALSGDHLTYFSPLPRQVRLDEVESCPHSSG